MVLSATLPGLGAGALKNREDAKALGTSKVCFIHETSRLSGLNIELLLFCLGIRIITVCHSVLQDIRDRVLESSCIGRYVFIQCCVSGCRDSR
jgi:hypothetical protein